jgi:hypothetical protein
VGRGRGDRVHPGASARVDGAGAAPVQLRGNKVLALCLRVLACACLLVLALRVLGHAHVLPRASHPLLLLCTVWRRGQLLRLTFCAYNNSLLLFLMFLCVAPVTDDRVVAAPIVARSVGSGIAEVYGVALARFRGRVMGRPAAALSPTSAAEWEVLGTFLKAHCRAIVLGAVGGLRDASGEVSIT